MKAIMYHYVRESNNLYPFSSHVDFNYFKQFIIRLVYQGYRFANVSDCLLEHLSECDDAIKTVMLTFDDGLSDHYHVAKLLHSLGINKATFYIPTYPLTEVKLLAVHKAHIIRSQYGPKSLDLLKKACDHLGIDPTLHPHYEIEKERYSSAYTHQNDDFRTLEFKRLVNYFGALGMRDTLLDQIISNENIQTCASQYYLSMLQIREMAAMGFEIGSHGMSHTLLSRLTPSEQHTELSSSKQILESIIQDQVRSFCYPYGGKRSYDHHTLDELQKSSYTTSMSVEYRDIMSYDIENHPYELPRYDCNQIDKLFSL